MANRYPMLFTRDLPSDAFWCVAGTVGLINLGRFTSPWILWPIFFLWLYSTIYRNVRRGKQLNKKGYFSGRRINEHWLYEEIQGRDVVALVLPITITGHARRELFIPVDSVWRATVPSWAWERRSELAARIAEGWKPRNFHWPDDLLIEDNGGR
jgi:hypothetical protein